MDLDRPTAAHLAIARFHLSRSGVDHFTLSVDGMHERSGALPIEMLGSFHRYRCMDVDCGRKEAAKRGRTRVSAFCPDCKSRLRHDLVFDGEQMRYTKEYHRTLETAEVLLLAGTNGNLRGFDSVRWMEERDRVVISVGENPGIIRRLLHSHQISLSADTVLPHLLA
jgi:NAD-dependent SIR2 family protein deacetylase